MKVSHRYHLAALMAAISLTAACQTGEPSTPDEETDEAGQALESADKHHRGAPKGGPHVLFRAALSELELTDEQRTAVEASLQNLAPPKPDRAAMEPRAKALADAVRAGTLDPKALAASGDAHDRPGAEGRAKMVAALQALHATLTPEQRVELVQAIEDKMADKADKAAGPRHARGKGKGPRGPGGASDARGPGGPSGRALDARGPGGPPHGLPAGHLLRGLDVSDEQRAEIDEALDLASASPRGDPQLVIEVIDHGIGIAPADLSSVFRPFFRVDRSRTRQTGGLGLGLALAKRIVEAHAGSIELVSEPEEGTLARVRIPIGGERTRDMS